MKNKAPTPPAKRPERILMTTDSTPGTWTFALELAQGMSRLGTRVALAAMGGRPSRAARADARRIEGLELFECTYKVEWMRDPWADVDAAGRWLLDLEQRFQPSIVHLNGYAHGALSWRAPVVMVAHAPLTLWWDSVKQAPLPPELVAYEERLKLGLLGADLVVAPTQTMLETLARRYAPLPSVRVIPHGRAVGVMGPAANKEPIVFSAGSLWDEAKNLQVLDAAAPKLSWPVVVAGDTDHPEHGTYTAKHMQTLGRLHQRTVAGWLARASVFALPSRYETFGLATLEAALSGCALVLGDVPTTRELWDGAAVFVPPNDPAALHQALAELIAHERFRRDLQQRALQRAQMYSGCRMLAAYQQLYREVLGGGLKPAKAVTRRPATTQVTATAHNG